MPLPLLLAQLVLGGEGHWVLGVGAIVLGEAIRLWAVGYIGPASRTRTSEVGQLVTVGPYGRLRNPLYAGNIIIWSGVGLVAGWYWALAWLVLMVVHYGLVVRWEEANLAPELGPEYRAYLERVPRWLPLGPGGAGTFDLVRALGSERSTFLALSAVGVALAISRVL
ncbi:MAG TPA: isoprenylcysteine carboxylmethyltransferase family protein [Myxococcota bacterium]|nr:isoprenylcysteine carboxylmethyltransferase family protein [Myxococcota bacterium]